MLRRSTSLLLTLLLVVAPFDVVTARAQDNSTPPDWRSYEQTPDGYAVSLPPTWRRIDLDPATIKASVDAAGVDDPATAAWLNGQVASLIAAKVSFFGFDFDPTSMGSGFATNANVIHSQLPGPIPLSTIVQVSVAQLDNLPNVQSAVDQQTFSGDAGQGEQLKYHIQLAGRMLSTTQYLFVQGTDSYVLTLTTTDDQAASYADNFDQIGKSFQIL